MALPQPRNARRALKCAAAAAVLFTAAGCAAVAEPIPHYTDGWSAVHGQGRGGDAVPADGPRQLTQDWTRDLTAAPTGSAVSGPDGQLVVSARTDSGCQLFVLALDTGRKNWCSWQNLGPAAMTPLIDQWAAVYVGNIGSVDSFDFYGAPRWHTPVIGTPRPLQFLRDRAVLAVTHLGQVNVLSTVSGRKVAPSVALAPANWPPPPDEGLEDCADAGPGCPVAFPPAVNPAPDSDSGSQDFYFPFRNPGTGTTEVVAMRYTPGAHHRANIHRDAPGEDADGVITELWRSPPLPDGAGSAPAVSADGTTVYIFDGRGTLWSLDAADGTERWHRQIRAETPPGTDIAPYRRNTLSVSPDGLIVAGPDAAGGLVALRDGGSSAQESWRRDDLAAVGNVAVSGNGLGYVVVQKYSPRMRQPWPNDTVLTAVDLSDGSTVDTADLGHDSGARGRTVITGGGRVVVIGSAGLVSVFG